jgi:hypothetical protein
MPGQTVTYAATGLPAGLTIAPASGIISGSPTTIGTSTVVVNAKDGNGGFGSTSFTWSVVVAITSANHTSAVIGQPMSFLVTVTGVPTSLKSTGKLPKGITFVNHGNGTATLSGTPKSKDVAQSYPLTITATYGKGKAAVAVSQPFTLKLT